MFEPKKLKGRRIAVLVADGFEKVELTVPVKALRAMVAAEAFQEAMVALGGYDISETGAETSLD